MATGGARWGLGCGVQVAALIGLLGWYLVERERPPVLPVPDLILPVPNGYDHLAAACDLLVEATPRPAFVPSSALPGEPGWVEPARSVDSLSPTAFEAMLPEKRLELTANAPAFAEARRALGLPIVFANEYGDDLKLQPLTRQMISYEAHVHLADGDISGAAQTVLDVLEIGLTIKRGGSWRGGGSIRDALDVLLLLVPRLDAGGARQAAARVERLLASQPSYSEAWERARVQHLQFLSGLMAYEYSEGTWRSSVVLGDGSSLCGTSTMPMSRAEQALLAIRARLITKQRVIDEWQSYLESCAERAARPYAAAVPPFYQPFYQYDRALPGPFEGHRFVWCKQRARLGQLACALALRAYRLEHRRWPEALADLVPGYLSAVPDDPFTDGRPLRFRPGGAGFGVYSVGPDGEDDGGQPYRWKYDTSDGARALEFGATLDYVLGPNR